MEFQEIGNQKDIEIHLSGRLTFTDHERLPEIVELLDRRDKERLVLDLSGLEFIDSAGIGMLLILKEEGYARNLDMIVRNPRPEVNRVFERASLRKILNVEP